MSDDLISRKALMEKAKDYFISADGALRLIESQPTAYDVDKVIEQLEERLNGTDIQLEIAKDFENKESISVKNYILFFAERKRMYEEVLKIVKSVGVADE